MRNIDEAVISKLKKQGKNYEILVDPEKAVAFKAGKNVSINEVLVSEEIYTDARKGTRASEHEIENVFATTDKIEMCKKIILEGTVQVTAEMLRKELEQKRKQIANLIHKSCVDPTTGRPHPPQRIENAMSEVKVKITDKPAEQQVKQIIDELKRVLPIKYEIREINVKISSEFAAKSFNTLKQYGKILSERWENDGSLNASLEIPAGLQEELEIALNRLTKGTVEVMIARKK